MKSKHTPGPWKDGVDAKGKPIVFQKNYDPYLTADDFNEEWQANLRLCDAAPDLLEALKVMMRELKAVNACGQFGIELEPALHQAHVAIAKAIGDVSV